MYKGCQRKMIMIKNPGGDLFDEAYFILKEKAAKQQVLNDHDMIAEANRIVGENMISAYTEKKKKDGRGAYAAVYILGTLSGMGIAGLLIRLFSAV